MGKSKKSIGKNESLRHRVKKSRYFLPVLAISLSFGALGVYMLSSSSAAPVSGTASASCYSGKYQMIGAVEYGALSGGSKSIGAILADVRSADGDFYNKNIDYTSTVQFRTNSSDTWKNFATYGPGTKYDASLGWLTLVGNAANPPATSNANVRVKLSIGVSGDGASNCVVYL